MVNEFLVYECISIKFMVNEFTVKKLMVHENSLLIMNNHFFHFTVEFF